MCGIAGIISLNNKKLDVSVIKDMTDIIQHRGPDSYGEYSNSTRSVVLGHRRLSIIDLSDSGKQPMEFYDLIITYNGEIYNYIELRVELTSLGYFFKTNTDTEVIIAAYKEWGTNCVNKFNGMWAFAIYDKPAEIVFCSRDRYGIKPFYYTLFNDNFYFASEIKCFTTIPGWKSKLNDSRAFDYLNSGFLSHTEETLFQDVYELKGGHNCIINIQTKDIKKYFYYDSSIFQCDSEFLNQKETIKKFHDLMTDSVRIALRSDVKVGSALSGGLDSSTIVAIINKIFKEQKKENLQECISACYQKNDINIDESKYIDSLSEHTSINVHKVFPTWEKFIIDLDNMVWFQDEPIPTMSIFAQYCVFEEAKRQNIKVMLDGQGADEILAGYESFYRPYFINLFLKNPLKGIFSFLNYMIKHRQYPFRVISKFLLPKEDNMMFNDIFIKSVKPFKRPKDKSISMASNNHLKGFALHSLLRFEDRNSMAFSIESRVPFLDYRIVNMSLTLNDDFKINKGVRKYILREAFRDILPTSIYARFDKLGFPTPQERWTSENAVYVHDLFVDSIKSFPKIFSSEILRNSKKRLEERDKDFVFFVWRVINFKKWVDKFSVVV